MNTNDELGNMSIGQWKDVLISPLALAAEMLSSGD